MNKRQLIAISLAGAFGCSALNVTLAQDAAPGAANTPSTAPARPGGSLVILDFKPAMDDLMTMLVQPRHLKLFYAGQAKNWTLAEFQLNELRAALARIGRTIPTYRNIGVDTAVASIFADKIRAVGEAIKAADLEKFTVAYGEMTGACNACHAGMEHPFLVMKVPDTQNYPDQDFQSVGH